MKQTVERGERGFTLIELVIAIAIMSVLLVALYSTFQLAQRSLFAVDKSQLKLQESRAFMDTLKRELESVLYVRDNSFCIFKMDDRDFYGRQASSLTLTTLTPLMKGLAKINYTVEEREKTLVITKSMVSAFAGETEENRMDLMEDIESFTLEAKYRDTWVKTWDSSLSKSAPTEVKITLTIRLRNEEDNSLAPAPFSFSETAKLMVGRTL